MPTPDLAAERVAAALDPVLAPLEFAPGQGGTSGLGGQVIFCRGLVDSSDGACVDLVIDLEGSPEWHIADVRYWGFTSDRWHLAFDRDASLADQLDDLARTLPDQLSRADPHGRPDDIR